MADVYQEQTPSEVELQFTARPGGDDAHVVLGYFPSSSVSAAIRRPSPPAGLRPARRGRRHPGRRDQHVGLGGTEEVLVMRAREDERGHPSRLGRLDAGDGVLDDEAFLGWHAELVGPGQEDLGMRLSLGEVAA